MGNRFQGRGFVGRGHSLSGAQSIDQKLPALDARFQPGQASAKLVGLGGESLEMLLSLLLVPLNERLGRFFGVVARGSRGF